MGTLPADDEVTGGQIIRDSNGNPTGMHSNGTRLPLLLIILSIGIFVDNAMNLIPTPPWTHDQMEEYFSTTVALALRHGLTSIHDADTKLPMIDFFKRCIFSVLVSLFRLILRKGKQNKEEFPCV